jgi:bilirubin oxidase
MRLAAIIVAAFSWSVLAATPLPGGTVKPGQIPKFVDDLVIPPAMPSIAPNTYDIAIRQFQQQVLPAPFPMTIVWGYGATHAPATFNYPAFTIEARQGVPVTVTWRNQLVDARGNFLPHLLPVDPTLMWANPGGPIDSRPTSRVTPTRYLGPVPIITHLHGGHVDPGSDGYPKAWYLPAASNIRDCAQSKAPGCFYTAGTTFVSCEPADPTCASAVIPAGAARFRYRSDQRAATLWYHDHALGMTRANMYAGLAGFYLHRDEYEASLNLPGPAPQPNDPPGTKYYEIPLLIQDRSFNADGSLFYPSSRVFFDDFAGPYVPDSDVSPIWNPEFFGNMIVVNGKTWPKLTVEARKYRFRILNGSDSRFFILSFGNPTSPLVYFKVIGNDGGFVVGPPIVLERLLVAPAERYDVVVDFSDVPPGTQIILRNSGPDSPFGGLPVPAALQANRATTGQVMRFDVVPARGPDTSSLPAMLNPPPDGHSPALRATKTRPLTLNEIVSTVVDGPALAMLGDGFGPIPFMDPITENPRVGTTEAWQIVNKTEDAHPIHLHQVQFEVVGRATVDVAAWEAAVAACQASHCTTAPNPEDFSTPLRPAETWEAGQKDTVIAYPGEVTKVRAKYDIPGLYVWHCHILSHEDNEMMRPYCAVTGSGVEQTCPLQ